MAFKTRTGETGEAIISSLESTKDNKTEIITNATIEDLVGNAGIAEITNKKAKENWTDQQIKLKLEDINNLFASLKPSDIPYKLRNKPTEDAYKATVNGAIFNDMGKLINANLTAPVEDKSGFIDRKNARKPGTWEKKAIDKAQQEFANVVNPVTLNVAPPDCTFVHVPTNVPLKQSLYGELVSAYNWYVFGHTPPEDVTCITPSEFGEEPVHVGLVTTDNPAVCAVGSVIVCGYCATQPW